VLLLVTVPISVRVNKSEIRELKKVLKTYNWSIAQFIRFDIISFLTQHRQGKSDHILLSLDVAFSNLKKSGLDSAFIDYESMRKDLFKSLRVKGVSNDIL